MTVHTRYRTLAAAAAAALVAPLVLVASTMAPADAGSARPHDLRMYKVEKYVALDGEYPDNQSNDVVLKCNDNDYVMDGMWKIDKVDDDTDDWGDPVVGDPKQVRFYASYSDSNKRDWHFRFRNDNYGRAQVKLWITCLGGKTEQAYNHTHDITITRYVSGVQPQTQAGSHNYSWAGSCPDGTVEVAPGFDFGTATAYLWGSWPEQATPHAWQWWYDLDADAPNAQFYISCLTQKTSGASSGPAHRHDVQYRWTPNKTAGVLRSTSHSKQADEQLSCDDHSKGLVGGFYIQDHAHVWYLGQEPRIKTRVFWFGNDGGGNDKVQLTLLCVNDRTSRQKL